MKVQILLLGTWLLIGVVWGHQENSDTTAKEREAKLGIGGALGHIAQDLFSRGTTNSQVLSLNLTNLVILLVVKALIFGAGHLGFGGHDHVGRSVEDNNILDNESLMSESELLLMLSYLQGDLTQDFSCLHYSACQDPKKAKEYLSAAKYLQKGALLLNISSNEKYDQLLQGVDDAINFGNKGYDCSARYTCQRKT